MIFVQDLPEGGGKAVQVFRHAFTGGGGENRGAVEIPGSRFSVGSPVDITEFVISVHDVPAVQFRQQGDGFSGQRTEELRGRVRPGEQPVAASGVFESFVDDVTGMQKESGAVFADRQNGRGFDPCADQRIGCGGGAEGACPAEEITEHETEPFAVGPFEKDGADGRKDADGGGGGSGVFQSCAAGERGVDGFQKPGEVFRREKRG